MPEITCPLPQVEESLRPYVRSRQEVQQIRQTIAGFFQDQLGSENGAVTSITLPSASTSSDDISAAGVRGDGLYRQYFEALAAHKRAQAEYEAVKADLEQLRIEAEEKKANAATDPNDGARTYVKVLQQKKKHERLEIIQQAVVRLAEHEELPTQDDIKQAVKAELGPPPDPPSSGAADDQADERINKISTELKKALVTTGSNLDEARAAKAEAQEAASQFEVDPHVEIQALIHARDELITWIETELAKVPPEGEMSEIQDVSEIANGDTTVDGEETVQALYDQYVASREALVKSISALDVETQQTDAPSHRRNASTQSPVKSSAAESKPISSIDLISYLPSLLQSARDEASLLQQTTHLRRQLNSGSAETKNSLQRLAGESQLVTPDSKNIQAWAKAAVESSNKTEEFVNEQIQSGEASLHSAREVLAAMEAKRKALELVQGSL